MTVYEESTSAEVEDAPAGTLLNAIPVSSFDTLRKIGRDDAYPLDGRYELTCCVDASGSENRVDFEPIGSEENPFTGVFEGNGFTISGLVINRGWSDAAVGLFGVVGEGARINGVNVAADVISGKDFVGGLVGVSRGRVTNCGVSGLVIGKCMVGGLVGSIDSGGAVGKCRFTGKVCGIDSVGGLAGCNWGEVAGSYSLGEVTGRYHVGGLVGENWFSVIEGCSFGGELIGEDGVGGLAGQCNFGAISRSQSTGKISGSERRHT